MLVAISIVNRRRIYKISKDGRFYLSRSTSGSGQHPYKATTTSGSHIAYKQSWSISGKVGLETSRPTTYY